MLPARILGEQIFGTAELAAAKLSLLVNLGMEIGAQPAGQAKLDGLSSEEVQHAVGQSLNQLKSLLPDYQVVSLAVPEGRLPKDLSILRSGVTNGKNYALSAAVAPRGGLMASPLTPNFDRFLASQSTGKRTGCLAEVRRQVEFVLCVRRGGADRRAVRYD